MPQIYVHVYKLAGLFVEKYDLRYFDVFRISSFIHYVEDLVVKAQINTNELKIKPTTWKGR